MKPKPRKKRTPPRSRHREEEKVDDVKPKRKSPKKHSFNPPKHSFNPPMPRPG
jgi:hypothetical protein